ncbi:MAG TPA: hypothetical protein VHJ20_00575, partial [Polyangia bacterium]|nr:hypothetical protein [Polyangia bacterium]
MAWSVLSTPDVSPLSSSVRSLLWLSLSLLSAAACAPPSDDVSGAPPSALTLTPALLPGASAALTKDVSVGDTTIAVDDVSSFARGELALVIQIGGATIDATDGPTYGAVLDGGDAGTFELVRLTSVAPGALGVAAGVRHAHHATAGVEVVRVPELADAVVPSNVSLAPPAWDGKHGGVFAISVAGTLQLDGAIDASALGFRGGALENLSRLPGSTVFASADAHDGAEKGESIAGDATAYDRLGGRYGRGAPANAGGGGDAHNAGGGGGANVGATLDWDGLGVPGDGDPWSLDPELSLPRAADPSGGGRGGYTYSQYVHDATMIPPGDPRWGGDDRRCVGGLGGHPLPFDLAQPRLFFGGGGGAGDENQQHGGRGGRGGGIVGVFAGRVVGAGVIRA